MSLLFNTLSRFVIEEPSFPVKKQTVSDFMAVVPISSDFTAQEKKICHYFHIFPFYVLCSDGARHHDLSFFSIYFEVGSFSLLLYPQQETL